MILLAARDVVAGFPGRPPVLRGMRLSLDAGRRVALLGANGSGKTTLLRCLSGAHRPDSGTVDLGGVPLRHVRRALRAHRRRVQLVLQDPDDQLFSADVTQDVGFGPLNLGLSIPDARSRVAETLDLLGIAHLADRATHQLSYGERKRVALAGAVAMRPEILLLDEPTAGLDPEGVADARGVLDRLSSAGTTLLIATHDVDLALEWADEVAIIHAGTAAQGEPDRLLGDADLLAAAHLRMPWTLELAGRLGLTTRPRSLDQLAGLIAGRTTG